MYINDLEDFQRVASDYFGRKARYQGTYFGRGYVLFDMYSIFPVRMSIPGEPYRTLEFAIEVTPDRATHNFLGQDLVFIENTKVAVDEAFEVLDNYCRLRLPDKFLAAFDAAHDDQPGA